MKIFKDKKIIIIVIFIITILIILFTCVCIDKLNNSCDNFSIEMVDENQNSEVYSDSEENENSDNLNETENIDNTDSLNNNESSNSVGTSNSVNLQTRIYIDISGEVNSPGLVEAIEGDRINDVIIRAGGATNKADLEKINLAYQVSDGQKIIIPAKGEQVESLNESEYIIDGNTSNNNDGDNSSDEKKSNSKVNINTASQTELETLTGIGPSTATKIINYRKENGKFDSIEDIKNVSGIGDAKFEKIKDEITV